MKHGVCKKFVGKGAVFCMAGVLAMSLTACVADNSLPEIPGITVTTQGQDPLSPVEGDPKFDNRLALAYAYYQAGRASSVAMAEVDKALELRPRSAEALTLKGMIYDQMGDVSNALVYLQRAASIEPNNGNYVHNYGNELCVAQHYAEGIAHLQRAAEMQTNTRRSQSWAAMGACYRASGDLARAESAFLQAVELEPYNATANYQLAEFMFLRNDYHGAKIHLERMGSVHTLNAQGLWLGVKICRQLGDVYGMNQYAKQLQNKFPNSREAAALARGDFYQ